MKVKTNGGTSKKFKKDSSTNEERKLELKKDEEKERVIVENESDDGEEEEENEEGEGSDTRDDDLVPEVEEMAKLDFKFEALPPAEEDLDDIERLLYQIFLQADIDTRELAKVLIDQSPMGCVFRPMEESEDEEGEAITYGVLSILPLSGIKKFQSDICALFWHRAKNHSSGEIFKQFEKVLGVERMSSKLGLLINERMLNFPAQIAGPAFHSLSADYETLSEEQRFEHILLILKVRICTDQCSSSASVSLNATKKFKLGKAARKRLAVKRTADSDIVFDNLEEQILFEHTFDFPFFQYSVESEIERSSKFHSIRRGGRIYRPFRRVCLLTIDQFHEFSASVARSYSV